MATNYKNYHDETLAVEKGFLTLNDYPEFQRSVQLARKLFPFVIGQPPGTIASSWADQCYRSSTSVSANIAEAVGRMQRSQIVQFFRFARGSCFETISHLSLCPVETIDLSEIRKQYINLVTMIDASLIRLIEGQN